MAAKTSMRMLMDGLCVGTIVNPAGRQSSRIRTVHNWVVLIPNLVSLFFLQSFQMQGEAVNRSTSKCMSNMGAPQVPN